MPIFDLQINRISFALRKISAQNADGTGIYWRMGVRKVPFSELEI